MKKNTFCKRITRVTDNVKKVMFKVAINKQTLQNNLTNNNVNTNYSINVKHNRCNNSCCHRIKTYRLLCLLHRHTLHTNPTLTLHLWFMSTHTPNKSTWITYKNNWYDVLGVVSIKVYFSVLCLHFILIELHCKSVWHSYNFTSMLFRVGYDYAQTPTRMCFICFTP